MSGKIIFSSEEDMANFICSLYWHGSKTTPVMYTIDKDFHKGRLCWVMKLKYEGRQADCDS